MSVLVRESNIENLSELQSEINKLSGSVSNQLLYIDSIDSSLYLNFETEVTVAHEEQIDLVIGAFNQLTPLKQVQQIVQNAINFGNQIIFDFTVENVLLGITQLGLTTHVRKVTTEIITALTTGSLYDAIVEVKALHPDDLDSDILTPARLLKFRNKLEAYLGLPLSENWDD